MENFSIDAYTPKEIAMRIEKAAVTKSALQSSRVFVLALLAGAFIAFGAAFYTIVIYNSTMSPGMTRLMGGLVFCLGLTLVVVAGAELFTGNNLLVMACVDKKITLKQLMLNWTIVFAGNFIGALGVVVLVYFSGHWQMDNGAVGAKAVLIANAKVSLNFLQALSRGILCNALVCLAVWLCFAGRNVTDKIMAIVFPITAFVALGFEHSVANMYFIPAGIIAQYDTTVLHALRAGGNAADLSHLNLSGLLTNLIPVTLGNIIGGSVFVGLVYWFIYLRE
ncbi:MAG: formate/nitrite transporter family protein [Gammaproteobacteria bacterium]